MNILVADDDKVMSAMLCGVLKDAGHMCVPAFDSMQVMMNAMRQKLDLVLLDINMPGGTGRGVILFCDTTTLTFAKPKRHYPLALVTLGDHLLKRRLDLGFARKLAANQLGVDPDSLKNWEGGKTEPAIGFYPRLISYLGYNPLPEAESRGSRIRRERISRGMSRKALADAVGVDEATIKRMEEDVKGMARRAIRAICHGLDVGM